MPGVLIKGEIQRLGDDFVDKMLAGQIWERGREGKGHSGRTLA